MESTRRSFIRNAVLAAAGAYAVKPSSLIWAADKPLPPATIRIVETGSDFEREPLIRPFGFKGGYLTEIWHSLNMLQSASGIRKTGVCTHSVLWSDASVFSSHSESGGNALMYALTEKALQMVKGHSFVTPVGLLEEILPEVYEYGKRVTDNRNLRMTFALNALVGLDNAAWLLYAAENRIGTFDEMIPPPYRPAFSHHHKKVAAIPLMAYNIPLNEIEEAVKEGYFFMKIKIGQPGTQREMLEKDKERITAIHKAIGGATTPYTQNGRLPYYFDANGRYENKETLLELIDHIRKIGALDQVSIIEEPFPEEYETDVSDIPVRLAADESAHTDRDAIKRMEMGYGAIAVKAIAKTLSMTMKIAQAAHERNIPCFCADLTVHPLLVEWNRNVAARLSPFPGLGQLGLLETNGHQNYRNWNEMKRDHPRNGAIWTEAREGVFELGDEFYETGGGIFDPMPRFDALLSK